MSSGEKKVVIITQARMTSTRLPGKVAIEVLDKTLLEHHLERLNRSKLKTCVVVATTTNEVDDKIVDVCTAAGASVFRGSEDDVLSRYYSAACEYEADIIVRVTSDCPLIDPEISDLTIASFLDALPDIDYVSNCRLKQTYPRGMDTEVFGFTALETAHNEATKPLDREHVTPFIWRQPHRFRLGNTENGIDLSGHRWTVDTPEDLDLITRLLKACYPVNPDFNLADCLEVLRENPEWSLINEKIEQKKAI
jgi:spore coat polysaccharide biosynthesis protein SpsF